MNITRKMVNASECDDCQPMGENLAGPFDSEAECTAHCNDNYTTGDLYVVYDDLRDSGYYLYDLTSDIQSPAFANNRGIIDRQ